MKSLGKNIFAIIISLILISGIISIGSFAFAQDEDLSIGANYQAVNNPSLALCRTAVTTRSSIVHPVPWSWRHAHPVKGSSAPCRDPRINKP